MQASLFVSEHTCGSDDSLHQSQFLVAATQDA